MSMEDKAPEWAERIEIAAARRQELFEAWGKASDDLRKASAAESFVIEEFERLLKVVEDKRLALEAYERQYLYALEAIVAEVLDEAGQNKPKKK